MVPFDIATYDFLLVFRCNRVSYLAPSTRYYHLFPKLKEVT